MFLFLCLACICRGALGSDHVDYKIGGTPVDWGKADNECTLMGFELANKQNTDKWTTFNQAIADIIPPNTKLWIDYNVEYTPWFSDKGCYGGKKHFEDDVHLLDDNHRGACVKHCSKFPYFALKGRKCSCWNNIQSFTKVDQEMCNLPCPGEDKEVCGGSEVNSIYLIEHYLELEENGGLCMTYQRKQSSATTKQIWRSSPCWKMHYFICQATNGSYIVSSNETNWRDAASSCRDKNSSLIRDERNEINLDSSITHGKTYWVGTFRDAYIIDGQEKIGRSVKKCLTVVKKFSDLINTEQENCTEKYRPLCLKVITNSKNKVEDEVMTTESTPINFTVSENKTKSWPREHKQHATIEYNYIEVPVITSNYNKVENEDMTTEATLNNKQSATNEYMYIGINIFVAFGGSLLIIIICLHKKRFKCKINRPQVQNPVEEPLRRGCQHADNAVPDIELSDLSEDHYDCIGKTQNPRNNYADPRGKVCSGFGLEPKHLKGSSRSTIYMGDNEGNLGESDEFSEDSRDFNNGSYLTITLTNPSTPKTVDITQVSDGENHGKNITDRYLQRDNSTSSSSYVEIEEKVSELNM